MPFQAQIIGHRCWRDSHLDAVPLCRKRKTTFDCWLRPRQIQTLGCFVMHGERQDKCADKKQADPWLWWTYPLGPNLVLARFTLELTVEFPSGSAVLDVSGLWPSAQSWAAAVLLAARPDFGVLHCLLVRQSLHALRVDMRVLQVSMPRNSGPNEFIYHSQVPMKCISA